MRGNELEWKQDRLARPAGDLGFQLLDQRLGDGLLAGHGTVADENAAFRAAITAAHAPAGTNILTIDGVHPIVPGHLLMARTLMAAFGASADDLTKLDQFWQDMPSGATVSAEMFIRGAGLISLRQYAVFKAAAEQQKLTVDELALKIYYEVMVQEVNAHATDPKPVSGMQYNNEFQKLYQARIDALSKP